MTEDAACMLLDTACREAWNSAIIQLWMASLHSGKTVSTMASSRMFNGDLNSGFSIQGIGVSPATIYRRSCLLNFSARPAATSFGFFIVVDNVVWPVSTSIALFLFLAIE